MPYTYADSWPETITQAQALREIRKHLQDSEIAQFFADCGECAEYDAETVLGWLGY